MFPFHNFYIKNFSAEKELEKIDQISNGTFEFNDDEGSMFSLDYAWFPTKRSPYQFLSEPVQLREQQNKWIPTKRSSYQFEVEPVQTKEQQKGKSIDITTPMALNEYKYSRWNNNYKKAPQSTAQPPNTILKSTVGLPSSQKSKSASMSTQQFYNHLDEVPKVSARNTSHSTSFYENVLNNYNDRDTSNGWFGSSQRSQYVAPTTISQMDCDSLSPSWSNPSNEFVPSQSGFHW